MLSEAETKPRVSILMGVYNCEDTLEEAFDSIINQTYQSFKIIVCDDGSVDSTFQIATDYANKYPDKVILIRNDRNEGLNYTLNRCLELADTEYCARMDGDDISLPTRLEKELEFLDSHPEYAIVSTPLIQFDENGPFRIGKGGYEPAKDIWAKRTPFCQAPSMVRTQAYHAVGGYSVSPKLLRVEDYHLWVKLFAKGYRGFILDEPLYMMRDDLAAFKRRNFKGKLHVSYVQRYAVRTLQLPKWKYIYSLRPIIVGLIPQFLYNKIHRK